MASWYHAQVTDPGRRPDGFDSRLEPIAFDLLTEWLLTRRAQAHFAVTLIITVEFLFQCILEIISV